MKRLSWMVSLTLALAVPGAQADAGNLIWLKPGQEIYYVKILSRLWSVVQVSDDPVVWRAVRDWNNLNPYGPPAVPRTVQATRAIEQATGCKVIASSMYQTISGDFFSQVACR